MIVIIISIRWYHVSIQHLAYTNYITLNFKYRNVKINTAGLRGYEAVLVRRKDILVAARLILMYVTGISYNLINFENDVILDLNNM